MDASDSTTAAAAGPFSHPPGSREKLVRKLLQADAKVVTLRPVIDAKSKAIAENQREDFKTSLAQELARVKLLNNKQNRKDKSADAAQQHALAEYRSKNVLATLSKAKPWLASHDDRAISLYNCSEGYKARAAETSDMLKMRPDDDIHNTGSPVITQYDPPSPPPADERGRRVFQTGGPTPSFSASRNSFAPSPQRSASPSASRPPSAASSAFLGSPPVSHTVSPSRPQSGFSASFASSRPRTACSVVSARAPFGGWADVPTRPLSGKQGFVTAEQSIGMEILQRRRCEVLGRSMWRLGKNERSTIAPKGKMEGRSSDFARELKRDLESKERYLAMLEGLFRWLYLLDEKCSAVFDGSVDETWEQIAKIAGMHNEIVKMKCDKCVLHLSEACEGKVGWKHADPPSVVPADHPCRYDFLLDWVVGEGRSRTALYSRLSKQWRDAAEGRKCVCVGPNDNLEWIARIVSWLFDSFSTLPTKQLDHELTDRLVIKMFDAFPSAPTKSKLLAMAVFLDACGYGPFMPHEMREALQQNITSEGNAQGDTDTTPKVSSTRMSRSISSIERDANDTGNTDLAAAASHLNKKADEVRDAKLECKDELIQLNKTALSVLAKEEAVSKAIYGNILQLHAWSKENESLFSGAEVGIVLNKVMLTFVSATRAYKSNLVLGLSRWNKKLALLKQQHQQLKLRLQSAKDEAHKNESSRNPDIPSDPLGALSTPPSGYSTPPLGSSMRRVRTFSRSKVDAGLQELEHHLGPAESFSPELLRGGSFAKFELQRRDSVSPVRGSPGGFPSPGGKSRRMSMSLRDSANRAAADFPELFEIPGFEAVAPSPPPPPPPLLEQENRQRRTTMDLFKTVGNAVLNTDVNYLDALIDHYNTKKLEGSHSIDADDYKEDREHLSVMFRKAVVDARKKKSVKDVRPSSASKAKISPEDVVHLMRELGEPVKLAQVVAFLHPNGYNSALGPSVNFDDFFQWWCYYHKQNIEEEISGALTSRSQ